MAVVNHPSQISFFVRPPKLPILIMDPWPIQAAHSLRALASALARAAVRHPNLRTVSLAGGDGAAWIYFPEDGFAMPAIRPRHFWTKAQIVEAYNRACADERDHYSYSLPNRSLPRVVAEVAALLAHRAGPNR